MKLCPPLFVLCFLMIPTHANSEILTITHYQGHERYEYGAKLLALAFNKLDTPFQISATDQQIVNEARGELEVISGNIDLQWMSTSVSREAKMIPVRIPIYQGVLGLRLLLINRQREAELDNSIRDIKDLRRYTGGHGLHWGDLPVYDANGLRVLPHKHYDSIFELLRLNRIDYFHRGINEIWAEQTRYQESLSIAENSMLFYPLPVYFFVTKQKPELAARLEDGLKVAIADGSFKQLSDKYMGEYVKNGKLNERDNLIVLSNPTLPSDLPEMNLSWWLPGRHIDTVFSAIY